MGSHEARALVPEPTIRDIDTLVAQALQVPSPQSIEGLALRDLESASLLVQRTNAAVCRLLDELDRIYQHAADDDVATYARATWNALGLRLYTETGVISGVLERCIRRERSTARRQAALRFHATGSRSNLFRLAEKSTTCEGRVRTPSRNTPRARGAGRPKGASRRSSSRSGDSGSDGPEPEPAVALAVKAVAR